MLNKNMAKQVFMIITLTISTMLSGCGVAAGSSKKESIPKLVEPAALNEAYRPVSYSSVGTTEALLATAAPREYCHYYNANVKLSQICVQPGDMVKPGDVLAVCDVDEAKSRLKEAQNELSHENESYEIQSQISDTQIALWKAQKSTSESDYDTMINTEKENASYNKKLHEYRVNKLSEQIADYEKIVNDAVLRASHDGMVTYIKRMISGNSAAAYENIVVVSDINDLSLEVKGLGINDFKYADYDKKYVLVDGQKHDVTEKSYTPQELVLAKLENKYPDVSFECSDDITLEAGQMYEVCFEKLKADNALVVGNDSLYRDDDTCYVYVKTADGGREKRIIETGESDSEHIQVIGGLKEGEEVYYNSTDTVPTDYTGYTVTRSDFSIPNYGTWISSSDANTMSVISEYEGQIKTINVSEGDEIAKGTLLYVIATGEGKAAITEAKMAIDRENADYKEMLSALDKEQTGGAIGTHEQASVAVKLYEQRLNDLNKQLATSDHKFKLSTLEAAYDSVRRDNDGKGNISVYAQNDGNIAKINVKENDSVEQGTAVMQLSTSSKDTYLIRMRESKSLTVYKDNIADIGESVSVKSADKEYTGSCVGRAVYQADAAKGYAVSDEKGTHIASDSDSGYGMEAFYVKMDEALPEKLTAVNELEFSYVSVKNAIVLPSSLIYKQTNPFNDEVTCYVWRLDNKSVVKQQVKVYDYDNGKEKLVLCGINEGDVLAVDK